MKKLLLAVMLSMGYGAANSQEATPSRFSFSLHSLFQAFEIPFADPETYIKNKGLSVAAAYDLSENRFIQQKVELAYFFNKYHGSCYMLSSSTNFNPIRLKAVKAGVSLGAGYMNAGFDEGGWQQNEQGEWYNSSNRRSIFFIPADLHLQVKAFEGAYYILSPTLAYQVNALFNYSHASTVLPQSLIKIGLNLHLK